MLRTIILVFSLLLAGPAYAGEVIKSGPGISGVGVGHGDGTNCAAGQVAAGTDGDGNAQGCLDPVVATEIDTLAELNAVLTDGDFADAAAVASMTVSTAAPVDVTDTCTAGDLWLKTSATAALYACVAADDWEPM